MSPSYQKLQAICKNSMLAENSNEADLASFTPSFLWLLRDFYLSFEEEGEAVCVLTSASFCYTHMRSHDLCLP